MRKTGRHIRLILVLLLLTTALAYAGIGVPLKLPKFNFNKPPDLLYKHRPTYPMNDSNIDLPEYFRIRCLIDSNGQVQMPFALNATPDNIKFAQAAMNAAKRCILYPAYMGDEAVETWCTLDFKYNPDWNFDIDSDSAFKQYGYSYYNPYHVYDSLQIIDTIALGFVKYYNDSIPSWKYIYGNLLNWPLQKPANSECSNLVFCAVGNSGYNIDSLVKLKSCKNAPFPQSSMEVGKDGSAEVIALVNRKGQVIMARIFCYRNHNEFSELSSSALETTMRFEFELNSDVPVPSYLANTFYGQSELPEIFMIRVVYGFTLPDNYVIDLNRHYLMNTNIINKLNLDSLNSECAGQFKNLPEFGDTVDYDKMPEFISNVKPEYPPMAFKAGVEGTLWLALLVNEDGDVCRAKILKESTMNAGFEASAIDASLEYKFRPAMKDSKPVAMWIAYQAKFKFTEEEKEKQRNWWREHQAH